MKFKREDIKEFLWSYRLIVGVSVDRDMDYYDRLDGLTKVTASVTGMPRGGGTDRHELLSAFADSGIDRKAWREIAKKRGDEVLRLIEWAPLSLFHRYILFYRYLVLMTWPAVKEKIDGMYESTLLRQIYREHNKALEEIAEWANESPMAQEILNGYFRHE